MWVSKDSYTTDNDEVTLIKRVEDVVLIHLKDNGYPDGWYQYKKQCESREINVLKFQRLCAHCYNYD